MSKADAVALVQSFAAGPAEPDDWPGTTRSAFAKDLIDRIRDPDRITQGPTSLCGPASFMRAIAIDMPLNYARCAIGLYRTGSGNIVGLDIAPRRRMKRLPPPGYINAADWITLGSVRDDENVIFSVASEPGALAGMTLPRAMVKWFKNAGYKAVSDQTHIAWWPLDTRLRIAGVGSNLLSAGYKVVMLIDGDIVRPGDRAEDRINFPNHWVTLKSRMFNTLNDNLDSPVKFDIYSWGHQYTVEGTTTSPLPLRRVLQRFYGFVAAKL